MSRLQIAAAVVFVLAIAAGVPAAAGDPEPIRHVLVDGRAPDGERYRLVAERRSGDAQRSRKGARRKKRSAERRASTCLGVKWPDVRAPQDPSWYCSRLFPPYLGGNEFGDLDGVAANAWSLLHLPPQSDRYLWAYGFARPGVDRVQVRFKLPSGEIRDAPVELSHPSQAVQRSLGSREDFKVFVTFLPRAAGRLYIPETEDREFEGSREPYEVIAYDESGNELSRVEHTNLANG